MVAGLVDFTLSDGWPFTDKALESGASLLDEDGELTEAGLNLDNALSEISEHLWWRAGYREKK